MALENYEELLISSFINVESFGWQPPTLVANFGGGFGAGAVIAPYGLRRWALNAAALPDSDDHTIDYTIGEDDFTAPRFTYFFEFFQRHLLLGNKPFVILDPRTQKKYLVAFPDQIAQSGLDVAQITAKVLSGGTSLVERRADDLDFNSDGSLDLDYESPAGSLAVSQNDDLYAGTVTITATVTDDTAIAKVEFYIDHEFLSEDSSSTYTASWDTTKHKNGLRKVRAKVFDTSGNYTWITVLINVENDRTPPTVEITSPAADETVSGTITIEADASDNVEVDRVEFYYFDGMGFTFISSDSSAPYTASFDTTGFDNGELVLSATAFDTLNNPSDAVFVTVNILNDATPPEVTLVDLVESPPFPGYYEGEISFDVEATDDIEVDHIDVFIDGALFDTITGGSGTIVWDTAATSATGSTETIEVKAIAVDTADNESDEYIVNVPVQNDAPVYTNWASAANGGTVAASSTYSSSYPASATIDDVQTAPNWGAVSGTGRGWNDLTGASGEWLESTFASPQTITEFNIFFIPSDVSGTTPPTVNSTTSSYASNNFQIQYWDGAAWQTLHSETSNDKQWFQYIDAGTTCTKWRVLFGSPNHGSHRVAEIEAWG